MSTKLPKVWAADLIAVINPAGEAPESLVAGNELWSPADGAVRLAGAANEVLNFQLVVEKSAGRVSAIEFVDAGDVEASLFQAITVPVGRSGFFDDPLVPLLAGECGDTIAANLRKSPKQAAQPLAADGTEPPPITLDRRRQVFVVELYIPRGAQAGPRAIGLRIKAGGREFPLTIQLNVWNFQLIDDSGCTADINNYDMAAAGGFPRAEADFDYYLSLERAYMRMCREHRALFHALPYAHSGRIVKNFAPALSGRGRTRAISDWSVYDKHWGSYLDGSAFAGCRGRDWPVEYLYTPVNCNWPALFEKFGTPGYWFEYQTCIRQMAAHFAERGWTKTKFEVFFNHKARWKYFPWDMDEIEFDRDNEATINYASKALEATRDFPQVQVVNRIDSSWIFAKSARTRIGDVVGLWVVNGGSHGRAPDEVALLRGKGQKVWFYGGAGRIAASNRMDNLRWPWMAWGRETDGFCWWLGTGWGTWNSVGAGGDHCLYSGAAFGVEGPLASIRLKVLHRGMQDHAYLTMVARKSGSRAAADAILARTLGPAGREDWYQRGEADEAGGADIITRSKTTKTWNTAPPSAWNAARAELAQAIAGA